MTPAIAFVIIIKTDDTSNRLYQYHQNRNARMRIPYKVFV